jgi:hypothetical protein
MNLYVVVLLNWFWTLCERSLLKKKWLRENTVISILDNVECFKYKLTRACEMEQGNFKQNQDKMKQWYDKDAMIRKFKSGEKVIVSLLIRCHPLQATHCWPFVIESRLNGLYLKHSI